MQGQEPWRRHRKKRKTMNMMNPKSNHRGGGRGGQSGQSRGGFRGAPGGSYNNQTGGAYNNQSAQRRPNNMKSEMNQRQSPFSQFPPEQAPPVGFPKGRPQQQPMRNQNMGNAKTTADSKGGGQGDNQPLSYGIKQREVSVIVTTAETATVVWCQLIDEDGDKILSMTNDLSSVCPSSNPVTGQPDVNKIYATKFTMDDTWYRCKVVETMQDAMCVVQYIDYGNKETKSATELVELPGRMAAVKPLCERFTLHSLKDEFVLGSGGFDEGIEYITNLTAGKQLVGEIYNQHYIVLKYEGEDYNLHMSKSPYANRRFPARQGAVQPKSNKPQMDMSGDKKSSFSSNLQQCPGFGNPPPNNDTFNMAGGDHPVGPLSSMPPALFGQPPPTSSNQMNHNSHSPGLMPNPNTAPITASEVLLKELQQLRMMQISLDQENRDLRKKLQSQDNNENFSNTEAELTRTMSELAEKKKENMKLQEDLYRLVRQHKDLDLNKRIVTLLESVHKVKLLRQQFPSDSTMDGIQSAIDLMTQSGRGIGSSPPVNHRVEEVLSLYTGAQDAVRNCQDKEELALFITKRNELRTELYSCINGFVEEMSVLPLADRCRDLNDAIVALETTHFRFLIGRELDNIRPMTEVVSTFANWKQAKMESYHQVRSTSNTTHSALNSALEILKQQLSLDVDCPSDISPPSIDLNSLLSKLEKDLQQEVHQTNVFAKRDTLQDLYEAVKWEVPCLPVMAASGSDPVLLESSGHTQEEFGMEVEGSSGPPPYSPSDPRWKLTYVDFTPKCLIEGGIVTSAKYETFDMLVARANDYLRRHASVHVQSLETTRFVVYDMRRCGTVVDTRLATYKDTRGEGGVQLLALRLWVLPKPCVEAEQVGYINVLPACLHPGGILTGPKFDSFSKTIQKLNKLLKVKPLPGRVVNIESVEHPFGQYSTWLQPDRCDRPLQTDLTSSHITLVRIYYTLGHHNTAELGYKDFIPAAVNSKQRKQCSFENIHDLMNNAQQWISTNLSRDKQVLNLETIYHNIKKASPKTVKTDSMLVTNFSAPDLIQTLRLWYRVIQGHPGDSPSGIPLYPGIPHPVGGASRPLLAYKIFWPYQLFKGDMLHGPMFENMIDTRQRMKDWALQNREVQLVSCETVYVKFDQSTVYSEDAVTKTFHRRRFGYNSEESSDFQLVSEILKTLMHHMKGELQRIDRLHTLQIEYTQLKSSLQEWLEKTPDLTPLKTLRSSIKAFKSQLRHRLADKADLEEGDESNSEELSQVMEDLDQIREQLHYAFDKEDAILLELSRVVRQHFPELCTLQPELGLENALEYGGLVKLGRSLEQFHTFALEGSTRTGVLRAKYSSKDVVLKEYIIEETSGLCKADFLREAVQYSSIKSPHLVELQGVFFLKSERHAYVQLSYYKQCLGNLTQREIQDLTPNTRYDIIRGVLCGLKSVHDAGLVHGAIHPNNVFINSSGQGVLADYYFSGTGQHSSRLQSAFRGLVFGAPECPPPQSSREGDMYCLGLIIMFLYQHLGEGQADGQQQPFGQMDPVMQGIVQNLLQSSPMERYSATELMNEGYFREKPALCEASRSKSPSLPVKEKGVTVAARLGVLKTGSNSPEPNLSTIPPLNNDCTPDITEPENKDLGESDPVPSEQEASVSQTVSGSGGGTGECVAESETDRNKACDSVNHSAESAAEVAAETQDAGEIKGDGTDGAEKAREGEQTPGGEREGGFSDMPPLEADTTGDSFPQSPDIPPEDEDDF